MEAVAAMVAMVVKVAPLDFASRGSPRGGNRNSPLAAGTRPWCSHCVARLQHLALPRTHFGALQRLHSVLSAKFQFPHCSHFHDPGFIDICSCGPGVRGAISFGGAPQRLHVVRSA